jgi:hypothetical protein|tara:strand:- start:22559 stop:22801 length:243 start_codon:yes stop_codon:yes gene_type:complete
MNTDTFTAHVSSLGCNATACRYLFTYFVALLGFHSPDARCNWISMVAAGVEVLAQYWALQMRIFWPVSVTIEIAIVASAH